ncbi:MAG: hypothetical protein V4819_14610 [Verrucomicrobiota bacterium]
MVEPYPFRPRRDLRTLFLSAVLLASGTVSGAEWVKPGPGQSSWGLRGGLLFAVFPGGFNEGDGGPRGLIRIGYPTLPDGKYDLINFIAIEPVVGTARGYSELEKSHIDGRQGKFLWTGDTQPASLESATRDSGVIESLKTGVEELTVTLHVEKFDNGAHVRILLSHRSDAPDELRLTVHAEPGSAPIKSCILTATMGNKARTRQLWLKDETLSSAKIFGSYTESGFAPTVSFPLARLPRTSSGDVLVAITNDEENPAEPLDANNFWKYRGAKVTQYWRKPSAGLNDSLRCAVNARFTYWMSKNPLPGGLAFENFELIEDFKDGQSFIFGVTKRSPAEILKQ